MKSILEKMCYDEFKRSRILNFEGKEGYCSINYHLMEDPVFLECGHHCERLCMESCYGKGEGEERRCMVCGQEVVEREGGVKEVERVRQEGERVYVIQ